MEKPTFSKTIGQVGIRTFFHVPTLVDYRYIAGVKSFKMSCIILLLSLMSIPHCEAQTAKTDTTHQLFIDFLKQEKLHLDDVCHYPFPFEDIDMRSYYKECPIVTDSVGIAKILRSSFLYDDLRSCSKYNAQLLLPHSVNVEMVDKGHYNARVQVAVPDSIAKLQFKATDIGITRSFDQLEVTLMGIEDDIAYLLLKDKSRQVDYTYTQMNRVSAVYLDYYKGAEEEATTPELKLTSKPDIYYSGYREEVYNSETNQLLYHTTARMKAVVNGSKGEVLGFETLTDDFREALWELNEDIPEGPWQEILAQWQEHPFNEMKTANDSLQHPLYVVRLQASGHISQLDLSILSNSQHLLNFDLQQQPFPAEPWAEVINRGSYQRTIPAPIQNETCESLTQKLKVVPYSYSPQAGKMRVVAFLPPSFNVQHFTALLSFSDQAIVHPDGKVTPISDPAMLYACKLDESRYSFVNAYALSMAVTDMPIPTEENCRLTGTVDYIYPNFKETRYNIQSLPKNIRYQGNSIYYDRSLAELKLSEQQLLEGKSGIRLYEFQAYNDAGQPVECESFVTETGFRVECVQPIAWFTTITNDEKTIRGSIPFDLPLPMPIIPSQEEVEQTDFYMNE